MTGGCPRDPFFIVGTGRCGTTLLQAMLNAHPGLYIPPETHFFFEIDPVALGFDDPVPDHQAHAYTREVTGRRWWTRLAYQSNTHTEDFAAAVTDGCRSSRDLFAWVLNALTPPDLLARRLGEKTPHHEKYAQRILGMFPQARFIHLQRDPRDVTEALLRMKWWTERSTYRTAVHWNKVYDRARGELSSLGPDRYHVVRYEDLVSDPRAKLESVCGFLNEPFHESMLEHSQSSIAAFAPSESHHKAGSLEPVSTEHVQKYRGRLSHRQIRIIERAVGPRLQEAGYTPDESVRRLPGQRAMAVINRLGWKLTGR